MAPGGDLGSSRNIVRSARIHASSDSAEHTMSAVFASLVGLAVLQNFSFFDSQGNQVAMGREIEDDVAAVGLDGVKESAFVQTIASLHVSLGLDQKTDGFQVSMT